MTVVRKPILNFLLGNSPEIENVFLRWRRLELNQPAICYSEIVTLIREGVFIQIRSVEGGKSYLDGQFVPLYWIFAEKSVVDKGTSSARILRLNFAEEIAVARQFITNSAYIRTFSRLTWQHLLFFFNLNPEAPKLFALRSDEGQAIFYRRQEAGFVSLTLLKVVGRHPCRAILEINKLQPVTVSAHEGKLFCVEADTRAQKDLVHYLNDNLEHTNPKVIPKQHERK